MKCSKCSANITDSDIRAEFYECADRTEIDIIIECPNRGCRQKLNNFVPVDQFVEI